jgi:hypothetical protein
MSIEGKAICQVCGADRRGSLRPAVVVRPAVAELIAESTGRWDARGWICEDDLRKFRHLYVEKLLTEEKGELTQLELDVLESLHRHEILSTNAGAEVEEGFTYGQRLADRIAAFGGSWAFLGLFALVLFGWMFVNSFLLAVSRQQKSDTLGV